MVMGDNTGSGELTPLPVGFQCVRVSNFNWTPLYIHIQLTTVSTPFTLAPKFDFAGSSGT
jgi:hypothetical protein